jgi:flagellar biosynthesis protein FlhF
MRVKRYIVDYMPEAMKRIRVDFGSDAIILSTKEIKVGGFLGMFQKKKIEVIAAVENEANIESPKSAIPQSSVRTLNVPVKAVPEAYKRTNEILNSGMKNINTQQVTDIEILKENVAATAEKANDVDDLFPSYSIVGNKEELVLNKMTSGEYLLKEMREMKSWMTKISKHSMMKEELPDSLQKLKEQLDQQEVDEQLREEWINAAFEYWNESGRSRSDIELQDFVRDKVSSFLSNRLGGGISRSTRVVYVAGPTGVGKTTTIAKLAAEQLFRHHRKVGFITSDTYRISAVEQLRTYASILNVPLEVVQSPADMHRAMQRLDYCDLIIMDTAGRNYRNELLVSELQSLLSHGEHSETYLVLSLTSKTQDMMKITEHFSKYGLDKVIFTKLDETGSYGAIFNLIYHYPIHLSYLTNGQNVPDDLLMPTDQLLSDLLLADGKSSYE